MFSTCTDEFRGDPDSHQLTPVALLLPAAEIEESLECAS
jgi:hypothetical protein